MKKCYSMKTLNDAIIDACIIENLEKNSHLQRHSRTRKSLTIVVAGGGRQVLVLPDGILLKCVSLC
jgi:NADH dehydrogenase FAD-containing subunit